MSAAEHKAPKWMRIQAILCRSFSRRFKCQPHQADLSAMVRGVLRMPEHKQGSRLRYEARTWRPLVGIYR